MGTQTSNNLSTISGIHSPKLDLESNQGTSNILTSFPSSELTSSSLFCGECSVNLTSSGSFFEHWVTHHCQLLQPSNPINLDSSLQHPQTKFNDAAAISSDEMKNLVISGNSVVDHSSEPTKELSSETSSTGLIMERCSVCNHIFVQGTDRHKQHSRAGPCVLNSNNQASNFQSMIPFNGDNLKLDIVQESVLEKSDASSNASLSLTVSQNVSHSTGNKKRKFGVISPTSSDAFVRNITKKHETPGISNHNKNCVCGVCNAQVKTITSYFLHWLEQHQDDSSLKNQATVNNPVECASSANILQEVWQCRACPTNITKLFPNSEMLTSHVEAEHNRINATERMVNNKLITSSCQIVFQNKESFDKHVELFHQVNHTTNDNSSNSGNKSKCPFCDKFLGDQANDNISFLCNHYRKEHLVRCKVCQVDLEHGDQETNHYLVEHKGEMVWNRKDRLKLIASDTGFRSKILSGAQKPTRLANGAIAKSLQGGIVVALQQSSNLNEGSAKSAIMLEACKTSNDYMIDTPYSSEDCTFISHTQVMAQALKHSTTDEYSYDVGCSPEKRKKVREAKLLTGSHSNTFTPKLTMGNTYSGKATIIASNVLSMNPNSSNTRGFTNKNLMEKFVPITDSNGGSGGSLSYRCTKCRSVFNSNEKVMEKHYFANHEFRCKFCDQVMDKDVYGAHLRQHLASERRKANNNSLSSSSNQNSNSSTPEHQKANKTSAR